MTGEGERGGATGGGVPSSSVGNSRYPWPSGPPSSCGGCGTSGGRIADPLKTSDGVLLVASPVDLLATKLKAILDRAEARDYGDIAALLRNGLSLSTGIAAFRALFRGEPATVLRAIGYFADVPTLPHADRVTLTTARDRVREIPDLTSRRGSLAVPTGPCAAVVDPFAA